MTRLKGGIMSIRVRGDFIPDRIYFTTFTIYKWISIFIDEKYFLLVYKWFDYMKDKYGNKIHGYILGRGVHDVVITY